MGDTYCLILSRLKSSPYSASLVAQSENNLPAMQETRVQFLGQEDSLEKEMDSLQYSFLENSMDRVAWSATVHGVTKSQT